MSNAHTKTGAVGILGRAGEDVNVGTGDDVQDLLLEVGLGGIGLRSACRQDSSLWIWHMDSLGETLLTYGVEPWSSMQRALNATCCDVFAALDQKPRQQRMERVRSPRNLHTT
jgi:hypothetical protein